MLDIKRLSKVLGKPVYSSDGDFFGEIEEVILADNRIDGWRIRVRGGMMGMMGGAKGVIIPHNFVKAIGDVFIITRANIPQRRDEDELSDLTGELA